MYLCVVLYLLFIFYHLCCILYLVYFLYHKLYVIYHELSNFKLYCTLYFDYCIPCIIFYIGILNMVSYCYIKQTTVSSNQTFKEEANRNLRKVNSCESANDQHLLDNADCVILSFMTFSFTMCFL